MARKKNFVETDVSIVDLGAKGKAVGKKDGKVYFVEGAVPGDICTVAIRRKRKGHFEGKATRIETPSKDRVQPTCEHFGVCGGCKWQNLDYAAQLHYKENYVKNNLERIGGVSIENSLPILGSADSYFYRNKLEFTFTNNRWLTGEEIKASGELDRNGVGFHKPGFWDKVLDINTCHLQPEPSNEIRNWVKSFAQENNLSFYNIREKSGFLRTLMIRTSSTGEVMVVFQLGEADENKQSLLFNALVEKFPQITSLQFAINLKQNDSIYDLDIQLAHGKDFITEEMPAYYTDTEALTFKIGAKSFYQTNSKQAFELYKLALDFAQLTGGETVYDLYTGTGTIALFLAQRAAKVIGIESVPEAINDANYNAKMNKVNNATFVVGDMKDAFNTEFIANHGKPDVIVTDPPRDGMHPKVVQQLLHLSAPRIVYVSCNPATQARDLAELKTKYRVVKSQAVDMFPHTHHIENVVLLEKK